VTKRQSKPTGKAPSWGRIIYDLAWLAFAGWATIWVLWGAETDREFVGAILGAILTFTLGVQLLATMVRSSVAAMAAQREAVEEALKAEGYETERVTGVAPGAWVNEQTGVRGSYKPGPY
jgi:hypothetical protein